DRGYWSGTPYFMFKYLSALHDVDLINLGPLQLFSKPFQGKMAVYERAFREHYRCEFEPVLNLSLSAEVKRRLYSLKNLAAIVSPGCFPYPLTFLDSEIPVVFWADATFSNLLELCVPYRNLCDENVIAGHKLQKRILQGARLAVYSSHWSAQSAVDSYGANAQMVEVIPFGANLHMTIEDEAILERVLAARQGKECRLMFTARSWRDRNGDFVTALIDALRLRGVTSRLLVAGCDIDQESVSTLKCAVEALPIITKDNSRYEESYVRMLASAHFLIHPSISNCYGLSICEANAWAVPAMALNAGGISSVVIDGSNGYLFDALASPDQMAEKLAEVFCNRSEYLALCRDSWMQFKTNLNWTTATRSLHQLISGWC
ncbi:MAG: glycosyltransferase family 4 protein, partial [Cyanobacteria bacterium]|nr:glycosyltransferase family 4 protein [Cyanobacteriota bacterium]